MSAILLEWAQFGDFDSFSIYRSETPVDEANPPLPIATNIQKMFYLDTDVVFGSRYNYRVACIKNQEYFFGENRVFYALPIGIPKGLVFSATSGGETTKTSNPLNPNATIKNDEWHSNFDDITDYSMIEYISYGKTKTIGGVINSYISGLKFYIFTYNGSYGGDSTQFDLEFLDVNENCIFAMRGRNYNTYGIMISFGSNLSVLTNANIIGSYPQFQGYLTIDKDRIYFTKTNTNNAIDDFNFNCDTVKIAKIRLSNLSSNSAQYKSNTRCYLKCLGSF